MRTELLEPHRSHFVQLIRSGAGLQDIHDGSSSSVVGALSPQCDDSFVERELARVAMHSRSLVPLLLAHGVYGKRFLDVGCSTGGTTLALALSAALGADEIVGVDPSGLSIAAARVRAEGLRPAPRTRFEIIDPTAPLPFANGSFDVVVAVSVLEFIGSAPARTTFLSELQRVTRDGGFIHIATPSPWRLRELHSRRWLGNFRRRPNEPWASSTRVICRAMNQCSRQPTEPWLAGRLLTRFGLSSSGPPSMLQQLAAIAFSFAPWRKYLFRKRMP